MTPEQLISKIQAYMQKDETNWVEKVDTVAAIQQLIDYNVKLAEEVRYYENVLVDLGYLRWI